ncbi:MAG TPA: MDR family MFS transporter [Cerasibacillus sp.]|uniref:MDR family MFS transporter n=1 Tax=Cerasibacillus sp. TaxID=2498711 RepID=UPI002F3F002B
MNQMMKRQKIHRPLVLASVMLGMFLAAIEGTIVATAMPSIVADLGGFSLYSWVFSAYLLTNASTVLIFGKLADTYGRKPIFIGGVIVFLIGSTLSGFAVSMEMLIGARFIQGVGAGALMPMATTIVGDIYTKEERAKVQGYLSSVWGISAVSGPLLGGLFVDVLHWRYVFWMNIPLGILAMIGILFFLHEHIEKKKREINYLGTFLLFITVSSLMVLLTEMSHISRPNQFLLLIGITIVSLILFCVYERRSKMPVMPLKLWRNGPIRIANLTALTTGMIVIGVSSYLPTYVQGIMGKSATIAGFTLTMMSIGWPIASTVAGRLLLRIGYRSTAVLGGVSLLLGSVFFYFLTPLKSPIWAGTGSFFIGVGMGLTSTTFIVLIQSSVRWDIRGIATASHIFMRSLGSTIGVAILGAVLNYKINSHIQQNEWEGAVSLDTFNKLLDPIQKGDLSESIIIMLREGLSQGLHTVYIGLFVLAIISFLLIFFMKKE